MSASAFDQAKRVHSKIVSAGSSSASNRKPCPSLVVEGCQCQTFLLCEGDDVVGSSSVLLVKGFSTGRPVGWHVGLEIFTQELSCRVLGHHTVFSREQIPLCKVCMRIRLTADNRHLDIAVREELIGRSMVLGIRVVGAATRTRLSRLGAPWGSLRDCRKATTLKSGLALIDGNCKHLVEKRDR